MLGDNASATQRAKVCRSRGYFLAAAASRPTGNDINVLCETAGFSKKRSPAVAGRRLSQSQQSQLLSSLDELARNRRVAPEPALRQRVPQPLDRREWVLLKLLVDCASTDLNGRLRLPDRRGQTGGDDELPLAIGAGPLAVETWMRDSPRDDAVA
jgi:hypothetical protein